jgi:hypothetical protein
MFQSGRSSVRLRYSPQELDVSIEILDMRLTEEKKEHESVGFMKI